VVWLKNLKKCAVAAWLRKTKKFKFLDTGRKKVAELSVAQKKKLVKELKNASKLHARQAVQIEKSMKNQKKSKG
jgi:hypothetical protein